jgi:hypothetical protein
MFKEHSIQITISAFYVKICELPISSSFPFSQIVAVTNEQTEITVFGDHPLAGQQGVICHASRLDKNGNIENYLVQLAHSGYEEFIPPTYLTPW